MWSPVAGGRGERVDVDQVGRANRYRTWARELSPLAGMATLRNLVAAAEVRGD